MNMNAVEASKSVQFKRNYTEKTLKILFTMSGNRCAEPTCNNPIVKSSTELSSAILVGQIAHIYALSDDGPRGKRGLNAKQRNAPDNLLLLCPTHHVVVDGQHETYPASLLLDWKEKQERPQREEIKDRINEIGFRELEFAADSLLSRQAEGTNNYVTIPPAEKISRNGLGAMSASLLTMGSAKSMECEVLITLATQLQPAFADRLRQGFVSEYTRLRADGLSGDDLFMALYDWAAGQSGDRAREAAGLCILSHLFIVCDVFEK